MAHNPRTLRDLEMIQEYERNISKYKNMIDAVKKNCPHHDYRLDAEFHDVDDIQPYKTCVVCGHYSRDLTLEQKKEVLRQHFADIEVEVSEEKILALASKY